MQSTSELWKSLWAGGEARLETVAVIAGTEYSEISNPVITRATTQDGLSIGNAVSATCSFSIRTDDVIPRSAEVQIRMRLTDGEQASEWLPAGTFYVSHRSRDPVTGLLSLECYDSLLKANGEMPALLPWTTKSGEVLTTQAGEWLYISAAYPRRMASLAADIALILGVEIDPRTSLATGSAYMIDAPEDNATIHDMLCRIAAANGGNWIMTPENKLRLVPVVPGLGADSVQIIGVVGSIATGPRTQISGVRYIADDKTIIIGTDEGIVVDADVSAEIAQALSTGLIGHSYQPYEMRGAIYDPAAELGDLVDRMDEIVGVLCNETATLGLAFRGDVSAPEPGEMADEYPYISANTRTFRAIQKSLSSKASVEYVDAAETRANDVTAALDAALNQQGVFNRLTGNGAARGIVIDPETGQIYINASYINAGVLNAGLLKAGIITDESGENYWILDGANSEFVTKKGLIGSFSIEDGDLRYGSQADGSMGAYIGKDGVSYNTVFTDGNYAKTQLTGQGVRVYWNGILRSVINTERGIFTITSYKANGDYITAFDIRYSDITNSAHIWTEQTHVSGSLYVAGDSRYFRNLLVDGDFTVKGTKNRQVGTEDYSDRLLYCYETASPLFGDVGEGVIGEDGRCYIWLDAVFAQTVSTDRYQVFLQKYGDGECWIAERRPGCFIVEGTPQLAFGWEIKAKQRDFDQRRLDSAVRPCTPESRSYGTEAAQYIERLKKGRIST